VRTPRSAVLALALILVCLPVFAADDCPTIQSFTANDIQTGEPVTLRWTYSGGTPQSQTLSGHDFAEPLVLPAGQTSYTYTPSMPGEKHARITAATGCGTVAAEVKYQVKQCNVVAPVLTVSATSVKPGDVINASIDLLPGHTARWVVTNGTSSATAGASAQITAGTPGTVVIDVFVKRGNSCEVKSTATIEVVAPCSITEPLIITPDRAAAGEIWAVFLPNGVPAGTTVTFEVRGAQRIGGEANYVLVMTPQSGSFEVDVIISNGTCTRRFTRTGTVTPCAPTATVSKGAGGDSCDNLTIVAEFTGTAPFQGYWSDGASIFSWEPRIERQVTAGGTYSITYFRDRYCAGTATGSATVGASLPTPVFTVSPTFNGFWFGNNTCPGMPRTASLDVAIPAGAELIWSVTNGTILGGQGTSTVTFAGIAPGATTLSAVFRDANGCQSATHSYPYLVTQGAPAGTVSVQPATIKAGETAIVTVTRNAYVSVMNVTSSLGDALVFLDSTQDGTTRFEYRSTRGGTATITYFMNSACGQSAVATTTLVIEHAVVVPKATVRAIGSSCSDWYAQAELFGAPPFSGTWSDGTTFTSDYPFAYLRPKTPGTYTLTAFSDASGPGIISGSATFDFVKVPAPQFTFDRTEACPNMIVTAKLTEPLAPGTTAEWHINGAELLSGQGTDTITFRTSEFGTNINVGIVGVACSMEFAHGYLPVTSYVQQPILETHTGTVDAGSTANFLVYLDPNTETWDFENSLGDPMAIVSNPQPNVYVVSYSATHGLGTSNIRVYGTTKCGATFETTRTIQIIAPQPRVELTSVQGETCGAIITATFTGTAPFTATWGDTGETFTTNSNTYTRVVGQSGFYYLTNISDANRADGWGPGVYADIKPLPFASWQQDSGACAGKTVTFTATNLPAGYTMRWSVSDDWQNPANATIVAGDGTSQVTVSTPQAGRFYISGWHESPEGCRGSGWGYAVDVAGPAANPTITLPASSLRVGEELDLTVAFDGNGFASLNWEASNGNTLVNMGQNGMTFTLRFLAQTAGTSTIRAYATTLCGQQVEATATIEVLP
jgi:hypothetical protein